jgi:hypothetical protein
LTFDLTGVRRGVYVILRVDGAVERYEEKPTIRKVSRAIGADTLDTVILKRHGDHPTVVMMVDDTGMLDHKPVNPKATDLYLGICKPGTIWSIHGDVAIVHDGDFA